MNKIVLFGGSSSYITLILSQEGELEQDLSQDPLIPGYMCQGSHSVEEEGKIYALGWNQLNNKRQWSMRVFDGRKWSLT